MTAPCKKCQERKAGCHASCAKYLNFRAECDARRKERNKGHVVINYFDDRHKKAIRERQRRLKGVKTDL